jgi:hypothetical protein
MLYHILEGIEKELTELYKKLDRASGEERKSIQASIQRRNLLVSRLAPDE